MLFTNVHMEPNILVQKALNAAKDWRLAQLLNKSPSIIIATPIAHWSPPFTEEFKCNSGFSWSKKNSLSGASWIVRDSWGNVIMHNQRAYSQIASVFEAKFKKLGMGYRKHAEFADGKCYIWGFDNGNHQSYALTEFMAINCKSHFCWNLFYDK